MLRLILIPISIVLLLLVAAVILVPVLLDKEELLELASEVLYEETEATLTVDGDIGLTLFPTVGISLADAGLTMAGSEQPDLQARSLEIGVQLIPLFSGNVHINTIRLDGMTARIESAPEQATVDSGKLSDEQLDAFYAARRKAMREADDAAGAELALAVPLALEVKHLVITDSRLELVDPTAQKSTVIELVRLETTGLNLDGKPIPLELQLRVPGEQVIDVALDGNIRIDQQTQVATLEAVKLIIRWRRGPADQTANQWRHRPLPASGRSAIGTGAGERQRVAAACVTPALRARRSTPPCNSTCLIPALFALAGPEAAAAASGRHTLCQWR